MELLVYTCSKNNVAVPAGILVSKKDYNDVMLFKHKALQYDVNNENGPVMRLFIAKGRSDERVNNTYKRSSQLHPSSG